VGRFFNVGDEKMEVVAMFKTKVELVNDSGDIITPATETLLGYAVLENGKMISPFPLTYVDASEWIKKELKRRVKLTQSIGMSM
jgi:hypothetical protein